jgi:hypothetical protein
VRFLYDHAAEFSFSDESRKSPIHQAVIEKLLPNLMGGGGWIFHLFFYRIPKNASTSISDHLGQFNLIKKHETKFRQLADKKLYRGWFDPTHAKPDEVFAVFKNEMRNYFSFCVVRNPWDRAVSMYHFALKNDLGRLYGIETEMTFELFCELLKDHQDDFYFIASHKQTQWMEGYHPPKVNLRFENLKEEFAQMLKIHNISHISPDIPHKNSTDHRFYREYYNTNTKGIINQVFEKDVDVLKYTF